MASLFGTNRLREIARELRTADLLPKIEIVKRWHNDLHNGTLRSDNETQREQQYNADFFKEILGYVERPIRPHTFQPKASTATGQTPDARIGVFDPLADFDDTIAVVELKGASISLDRPQRSQGNLSPVQQGFKYQPQYRSCAFVIVSNFAELRLYNDNQLDYESWTLDDLVDPSEDYLRFKTFYWLLCSENLLRSNGFSATEGLLSDIRIRQDEIGATFYREYSQARLNLLKSLYKNNEAVRSSLDLGIEKAQKIIDRVVFVAFAEDRGLLPDDTLQRLRISGVTSGIFSMWQLLKTFFDGVDKGSESLEIPVGFNGGLFARDDDLDALVIDDSAIHGVLAFGKAKFDEDLSVTILGHIFEQSVSDLSEIRDKVTDASDIESLSVARRRNDGIYYTPEHMVRYIVDRSLGQYMRDREQAILREFGLKEDIQDTTYAKREREAYLNYREFLLKIKVVDPAAGSGAFLVQVYDFLMAESLRVAAILDNDIFSNEALAAQVLRNNIYGVDLNEESVEITKLSLWLKSASKGHKLIGLDDNIRVGNSLQPQAEEGATPFRWKAAFADVFAEGGFDVVVGNPPYVKEFTHRSAFEGLKTNPVYQGKMDLWYFFGSLALDLVKPEIGRIAFIADRNWVTNAGASKFRDRVLTDGKIIEYFDFGDYMVFDEAAVQTMVYVMARSTQNDTYSFGFSRLLDKRVAHTDFVRLVQGAPSEKVERFEASIVKADAIGKPLTFNNVSVETLLGRISDAGTTFLRADEVATGIDVHQDYLNAAGAKALEGREKVGTGIFNLSEAEYQGLELNAAERALVRPFYTSEQLGRYYGDPKHKAYVIYTDSRFKSSTSMHGLPTLKAHLDRFQDVITSDNAPYGLHRARDERFFVGEKIISIRKTDRPTFTYADFDAYVSQTYFVIKSDRWDMKALTAVLNSTVVAYWLTFKGKRQGTAFQVDKEPLLKIPLLIPQGSTSLTRLTQLNIDARAELHSVENQLQAMLSQEVPTWVHENPEWWSKGNDDLLATLPMIFALNRRAELVEVFDRLRQLAIGAVESIRDAELEADDIVFEEYGIDADDADRMRAEVRRARFL